MKHHPLRTILGRPALHLLLTCAFIAAFCWPILAMTRPTQTFHFLYVSWIISLVALFAISRAAPVESAQALNQEEDRADGSSGADEITRESL
jgi:FtsH-binding integral membrane protein